MFHLCKATRLYDGRPYCGFTSQYKPAEFATLEEAKQALDIFQAFNPVGWSIWDADTGKIVE